MTSVTASVFVLGLLVAGVVCYVTPRMYQARSVFEPLTTPGVTVGATDPETVAAILTSKECLLEVCDHLDLEQQWKLDRESACQALRQCVTVAVQPNGRLVEVTVRLDQPTTARDVAAELPRTWGRRALKLAEQQYTNTIVRAENGAETRIGSPGRPPPRWRR
ncbi:MAG: hypothetical protein K9N23_13925 [Akkermansiaceae bacterium]|nr:hypothetical protein [Akkermansiaceae bacterium]